jgi:hypothetical protein
MEIATDRFWLSCLRERSDDFVRADRLKFIGLWQDSGEKRSAPPQLGNCRFELPAIE